jgi:hypothetical protein
MLVCLPVLMVVYIGKYIAAKMDFDEIIDLFDRSGCSLIIYIQTSGIVVLYSIYCYNLIWRFEKALSVNGAVAFRSALQRA